MHPIIKFKIDYKKDLYTLNGFLRDSAYDGGRNLDWAIFKKYPEFKKYKKERLKKEIKNFLPIYYNKNKKEIDRNIKLYKNNWQKIEKKYYFLVDQLFSQKFWPKGKYIVYSTIWGMFPRFLEDKTFQIPAFKYKKIRYINVIIAHELLHFIFYNYFYNKYPKYKKDKYNFLIWNVSEIFNSIIQNSPSWFKIFKIKSMVYPEHKKIIIKINKKYKNKKIIIDDLIKDILKELKKTDV